MIAFFLVPFFFGGGWVWYPEALRESFICYVMVGWVVEIQYFELYKSLVCMHALGINLANE